MPEAGSAPSSVIAASVTIVGRISGSVIRLNGSARQPRPSHTELIPNVLMMAMHLCGVTKNLRIGCGFNIVPMWHPLRLAEDFEIAGVLTGGRVIFGVGRGYHTRGREFRRATDRPERQPQDVRGGCQDAVQGVRGRAVLAPGQVLHVPATTIALRRLFAAVFPT
jgi:hypothetical protein